MFWKTHLRDAYLDELLRGDGCGEFRGDIACPDCKARRSEEENVPVVRCRDCFSPDLTCERCCIRRHIRQPFHNVEVCAFFVFFPMLIPTSDQRHPLSKQRGGLADLSKPRLSRTSAWLYTSTTQDFAAPHPSQLIATFKFCIQTAYTKSPSATAAVPRRYRATSSLCAGGFTPLLIKTRGLAQRCLFCAYSTSFPSLPRSRRTTFIGPLNL